MLRLHHPQSKWRTRHPKNRRAPKSTTHNHLMPYHRQPRPNRNTIPRGNLLKRPNYRNCKKVEVRRRLFKYSGKAE
uniref:Uncharacterized protein n=1 Tax=Serinus canaria TaxID=9135 RepID=A0A8C9MRL3_SERCA